MPSIRFHPEVAEALQRGLPVVALESAVITTGLPREPLPASSRLRAGKTAEQNPALAHCDWNAPLNLELGRAMQRVVRAHAAIPATIAIIEGDLCIGLEDDKLVMLASEQCAAKASVTDLAFIMSRRGFAGTTVSATMAACRVAHSHMKSRNTAAPNTGICCFATGGIGGVHRNWQTHPDISADLRQIAATPVCVVCSGAKSILDLPATLEALEALGVPVIGYRTDRFPQFLSEGDDHLHLARRIDDVGAAADLCGVHWETLGLESGILLANPVPSEFAMRADELESAIEQAERNAAAHRISGAARTPFLLKELAHLTSGRSLDANIALLLNNARLAAELVVALRG